jgi:hypothetical protein
LNPKDYKSLERYQKEVGISWNYYNLEDKRRLVKMS